MVLVPLATALNSAARWEMDLSPGTSSSPPTSGTGCTMNAPRSALKGREHMIDASSLLVSCPAWAPRPARRPADKARGEKIVGPI